ncbi:hypothetical protein SDC9_209213 [bioreactor metagenome]|uniref:Uncharacterized protein n=1 Tax=bioreactor metagenome TaxID=1076179 RepID=A0A645JDE0_9ZZZZ
MAVGSDNDESGRGIPFLAHDLMTDSSEPVQIVKVFDPLFFDKFPADLLRIGIFDG